MERPLARRAALARLNYASAGSVRLVRREETWTAGNSSRCRRSCRCGLRQHSRIRAECSRHCHIRPEHRCADARLGVGRLHRATRPATRRLLCIYDRLLDFDADMKIVPQLATSYEMSPDLKSMTLKLRAGRRLPRRHALRRCRREVQHRTDDGQEAQHDEPAALGSACRGRDSRTRRLSCCAPPSAVRSAAELARAWFRRDRLARECCKAR